VSILCSLKHRSASSNVALGSWEFTPVKGCDGPTLFLRLRLGSRVHDVDVPVCSEARPVPDRWIVTPLRGSREAWLVCGRVPPPPKKIATPAPFILGLPEGHVELLCCPPNVADELARL
jgi:hypothetical protein